MCCYICRKDMSVIKVANMKKQNSAIQIKNYEKIIKYIEKSSNQQITNLKLKIKEIKQSQKIDKDIETI